MSIYKLASANSKSLLANRYQLQQLIGYGGMGEVFLAEDTLLGGVPVAIKFLSHTVLTKRMQQDFGREARICAKLSQQTLHIVRVMDYGVSDYGKPFYVMEYLQGKSLKDLIPMSLPMFLALSRQICLGLQCAHQGVEVNGKVCPLVHRDIKPGNVIVLPDPILGQLAKVLDFGIARFVNSPGAKNNPQGGFTGTLSYSSPEQIDDSELDARSDIYSLGVMMFEMLTGEKPWQPETDSFGGWYKVHHFDAPKALEAVKPDLNVPPDVKDLIMACMAKSASSRPQSLTEVLQVLEGLESPKYVDVSIPVNSYNVSAPTTQNFNTLGSGLSVTVEQECWQQIWPKDKPKQEIVFPQLIATGKEYVPALGLMLSKQEISNHRLCNRYNDFTFICSPHPMLLWLSVLYTPEHSPKWLKCYLDMQNLQNQQIVRSLFQCDRYPLIFFTLEAPHTCGNVMSCGISPTKRQLLQQWLNLSQNLPPSSQAAQSKQLLQHKYKQMQANIEMQLESLAVSNLSQSTISAYPSSITLRRG